MDEQTEALTSQVREQSENSLALEQRVNMLECELLKK